MTTHWGEFSEDNHFKDWEPDVSEDIEKSMNKFCLAEFDSEDEQVKGTENIRLTPMDPLMMYAISLHKYASNMTEIIKVAELATEMNVMPSRDAAPPIPPMPVIEQKHRANELNYIPKEFTSFSMGEEVEIPELSNVVVKQIMSKCIATMFAHIGYETTHQSILDILTDVLEEFYRKISHSLKTAAEAEETHQSSGFPHIYERVLVELGLGGIRGLNDYYQSRVVKYVDVLRKRYVELNNYYESLFIPKVPFNSDSDNNVIRVMDAQKEEIGEKPEVHLEDSEGAIPSLEAGYHILNSMEDATDLNLDKSEDLNATSEGGMLSMPPEQEMTSMSPFPKKKKYN